MGNGLMWVEIKGLLAKEVSNEEVLELTKSGKAGDVHLCNRSDFERYTSEIKMAKDSLAVMRKCPQPVLSVKAEYPVPQ